MALKPALGKGLASLLPGRPDVNTRVTETVHPGSGATSAGQAMPVSTQNASHIGSVEPVGKDRHLGISMAHIEEIQTNQFQPRRDFDEATLEELARSIRTNGIIQPLVVRRSEQGYELIAGERRLRAAKKAGLKQVPIVIRRSTDREALELALVENIQRQDLNCIDEALAYFQLVQDFSLTQEEVAERVGKDRATVANFLRLLRLPEAIIQDLKNQVLTLGHGKALLGLEEGEMRLRAREEIVKNHLSVRETEALVDRLKAVVPAPSDKTPDSSINSKNSVQTRLASLSQELSRHWSTKVELKGSDRQGKIVLHYGSRAELDRILEAMQTNRL